MITQTPYTTQFRGATWRLYAVPKAMDTEELIRMAQDALVELRRIHGDSHAIIDAEDALDILRCRYVHDNEHSV